MKISLIHPSRQRLVRAEAAIREWTAARGGAHTVEHILSVDADDPDLEGYRALAARHAVRLVVGPNRTMVEAVNRGAAASSGDLLVSISDDFGCPPGWDTSLVALIDATRPAAVLVDDGLGARIMTLPIMTRGYYERLGYIYHPSYISMFADDDVTATARHDDALIDARHLLFPHRHCSAALSDSDATYLRQNSRRSWWHGWRVYQKRRLLAFGRRSQDWRSRLACARVDAYYLLRMAGSRVRRLWLRRLPPHARHVEDAARRVVLDVIGRLTAIQRLG